jgi:diguanylate cyclase (GGDEF)-like protein/PAS domain S-box-containing protein
VDVQSRGRNGEGITPELREVTPDATIGVDDRGRVREFDPLAERIFGLPADEVLGRELFGTILPPELRSSYERCLARSRRERGEPALCRLELAGTRTDGPAVPLEVSVVRWPDRSGGGVTLLVRDLRARRAAEQHLAHSEALLAEAEAIGGFGSFELDLYSGVLDPSENLVALMRGGPQRRLSLRALLGCFTEEGRAALAAAIGRARTHGAAFDLRVRLRDGRRILRARGRVTSGDGGRAARLVATMQDVTEEVEARTMREFLGHIVASSHDAIYTKSADGTITSWNRGAERLYGYSAQEVIGTSMDLIVPPAEREAQLEMLATVIAGQPLVEREATRLRKDGTTIEVSLSLSPVHDADGRIVAASVIAHDVTERKRYEERLQYLADHDPLTDLLNRRRFEEALQLELERANRYGTCGAVVIVDVDGLKRVNDTRGHAAGDAMIVLVARTLHQGSRASDIVARLGGDEFGVLLPAGTADQAAAATCHLLQQLRARPLVIAGRPLRVSASAGVAPFDGEQRDLAAVMAAADLALYEAKRAGRDTVAVAGGGVRATVGDRSGG